MTIAKLHFAMVWIVLAVFATTAINAHANSTLDDADGLNRKPGDLLHA
jgi:hypothetical protein